MRSFTIYVLHLTLLCSLLQPPATSSLLGPNILLSTLFSVNVEIKNAYIVLVGSVQMKRPLERGDLAVN
jgi:hypothetical protein